MAGAAALLCAAAVVAETPLSSLLPDDGGAAIAPDKGQEEHGYNGTILSKEAYEDAVREGQSLDIYRKERWSTLSVVSNITRPPTAAPLSPGGVWTNDKPALIVWLHGSWHPNADSDCGHTAAFHEGFPKSWIVERPLAQQIKTSFYHGDVTRAWANFKFSTKPTKLFVDDGSVQVSHDQITALVDAAIAKGVPKERVVIAGYSLGAAMATEYALHGNREVLGAISAHGWLLRELKPQGDKAKETKFIMYHGCKDTIIPCEWSKEGARDIESYERSISLYDFPKDVDHKMVPYQDDLLTAMRDQIAALLA